MTIVDHKYVIVVGYLTDSGVVQCFGPFDTEQLANEALDYLKTWDSIDLGGSSVEVKRVTPLPPFSNPKPEPEPFKLTPRTPVPLQPYIPGWPHGPIITSTLSTEGPVIDA